MNDRRFDPGAAGDAEVHEDGRRWTLVFRRDLAHSPEKVWMAITDPAHLAEWAPFDPDRSLAHPGAVTLTTAGSPEPERLPCTVKRADAPRLLEYTWGDDLLRWELERRGTGTLLTLRHTMDDRSWLARVTAGWHICIDVLDRALSGRPVGRMVADEAKRAGWERLNDEYARRFGLDEVERPDAVG